MSLSAVTSNQYAYLDQQVEGGAVASYSAPVTKTDDPSGKTDGTQELALFGDDGFGFDDFLDIINPLQHLPVISNIYRELTGDELSPGARMIGGGIFGGGIGLAASVINTAIEAETGKDLGAHVMALFSDDTQTDDIDLAPAAAPTTAQIPTPIQDTSVKALAESFSKFANAPLNMGLQWKNQAPGLKLNIEQARALHENNLTSDQMSQILDSFKLSAPAVQTSPASIQKDPDQVSNIEAANVATATYEKQPSNPSSGQFNYIDQLI